MRRHPHEGRLAETYQCAGERLVVTGYVADPPAERVGTRRSRAGYWMTRRSLRDRPRHCPPSSRWGRPGYVEGSSALSQSHAPKDRCTASQEPQIRVGELLAEMAERGERASSGDDCGNQYEAVSSPRSLCAKINTGAESQRRADAYGSNSGPFDRVWGPDFD